MLIPTCAHAAVTVVMVFFRACSSCTLQHDQIVPVNLETTADSFPCTNVKSTKFPTIVH